MKDLDRLLPQIFIPDLFQPGFDERKHRIVGDPEPGVVVIVPFRGALFPESSNNLVTLVKTQLETPGLLILHWLGRVRLKRTPLVPARAIKLVSFATFCLTFFYKMPIIKM